MRKLLLAVITLCCLYSPAWAQPDWAVVEEREGGFSFRAPADWKYRGKAMMGRYLLEFPAGNLVIRVEKSLGQSAPKHSTQCLSCRGYCRGTGRGRGGAEAL